MFPKLSILLNIINDNYINHHKQLPMNSRIMGLFSLAFPVFFFFFVVLHNNQILDLKTEM